jgi:probable phosphoglycerate mutase
MANRSTAKPTLVFLVRHGLTPTTGKRLPGQAAGLHLSDKGRQMAEQAAERLAVVPGVAAVYASPLERTRETATPIARALGLRVRTDRALLDSDAGEWTGLALSRLRRKPEWETVTRYPSGFRFPGGESFVETQARVTAAVERLRNRHAGHPIVLVSHADPIRLVLSHALGSHLDLFQRLVIAPCSISAVVYTATGPMVLTVNSTGDLGSLMG